MSEHNQKGSLRQLPPGKLSDIKKIFEDGESNSTNKGEKPAPPARPPPPPTKVMSPVRHQLPQQHPQPKSAAIRQQQPAALAIEAAGSTTHLKDNDDTCRQQSSNTGKASKASNQSHQAKDANKISSAITGKFTVPVDNPAPAKNFGKVLEKSQSFSSTAQPPKPALRHSHEHSTGEEPVTKDISELYAKVNKPKKDTETSSKNVNFSFDECGIRRMEAMKKSLAERRKTIAGCEAEIEETENFSVNVAQRKKIFDASNEDKPNLPQKPDFVTRKLSMRTNKEFEVEQQKKLQTLSKNGHEPDLDSLYDPPWDLSKNSVLEKLKKSQQSSAELTPSTAKCDNAIRTAAPPKPPVPVGALKKADLTSHKLPDKESELVTIRGAQLKAELSEVTSESSPRKKMGPPPKPPRTHAHDDYLRVKITASPNLEPMADPSQATVRKTVHIMDGVNRGDSQEETEYLSIKDRINKMQQHADPASSELPSLSSVSLSNRQTEQNITMRNQAPSRPPPPKRRPSSGDHQPVISSLPQRISESQENGGPVIIPVSPRSHQPLEKHLSDVRELRGRRPSDKLPPEPDYSKSSQKFPLRKSYSSECLHSSRGSSLNGEVEDVDSWAAMSQSSYSSQYEAVIDPDGYAVPNVFVRLPGKKIVTIKDDNLDLLPSKFLTRIKGFSGESLTKSENAQGNRVTSPLEQSLDKVNKKKMTMVKHKINQAYAGIDIAVGHLSEASDSDWHVVDIEQDVNESVIEPTVLKKRIEYCTSVRLKSSQSIRHCKEYLSAIYPQLFEYCLIVGLQQLVDAEGYQPYVIHKFPENVSSNLSVPNFCFPDATLFKPGSATTASESYSFVMTNSDGSRVYGYCRRIQPPDASLPEVICIISPIDAFNMYNTLLSEIEVRRRISLDQASELIAASFGRPLPKPGKVCHIRTLDINGDMETIFLNRPADNKLENVNYESPLHFLGTDRLVKVFSSMLMERRIILCSSNLSVLTQTVYALSALLYPFHWQHVYIPLLPHDMLDVLCAPVPYIVGVLTAFLPKVLKLDLEEVFIVDLDKKNIVKSPGDESTILPKRIQKALKTAINMCKIDAEARNAQWLMVAEAFLRMFIETVGHFNNHIRTQQDGNRIFQKEGFISEAASKEVREFLSWFTETQMFEVFIVDHVEKSDYGTIDLFMQRLVEYRESKEEFSRHKGLGAKVKNFGKALKTKLQAS